MIQFQKAKINRSIITQGKSYIFKRYFPNSFGEKLDIVSKTIPIKGIFHNAVSYITVQEGDSTRKIRKFSPSLLVIYEDFQKSPILMGDRVEFAGKKYEVNGTNNSEEENYAVDISLEVMQFG